MGISGAIIQGDPRQAVRACVKDSEYVVFKDSLVNKELLGELRNKLRLISKYVEARGVIEDYGLKNADEILAHLGFIVKWRGLDPNEARITLY